LITGGRLLVPRRGTDFQENRLRLLRLHHCTLLPGSSPVIKGVALQAAATPMIVEAPDVKVELDRCIVAAIRITDEARIQVTNSIIDAGQESLVAFAALGEDVVSPPQEENAMPGPGAPLTIENSTVIGKVHTLLMERASNTIFLASLNDFDVWPSAVIAERVQQGCVRFCYVPPGSRTPRRYQCQPDMVERPIQEQFAIYAITQQARDRAEQSAQLRVRPVFTSLNYGDAGYGQLGSRCTSEITQGADDQSEMGAFHALYQTQRVNNIRARLDEYLRFGLEAGIFYAS
jgi:hypothetical protein